MPGGVKRDFTENVKAGIAQNSSRDMLVTTLTVKPVLALATDEIGELSAERAP